jgi:hypothetical protein
VPYRATFGKKSGKVFIINDLSFLVLGKNWEKTGKKIGKLENWENLQLTRVP